MLVKGFVYSQTLQPRTGFAEILGNVTETGTVHTEDFNCSTAIEGGQLDQVLGIGKDTGDEKKHKGEIERLWTR